MEVELVLKKWKVELDKEKKMPKIVGDYSVRSGGVEIAEQRFNDNYNSKELHFSSKLMEEIVEVEKKIIAEVQSFITK